MHKAVASGPVIADLQQDRSKRQMWRSGATSIDVEPLCGVRLSACGSAFPLPQSLERPERLQHSNSPKSEAL